MCVFCWFSHSCRLLALVSFSQLLMIGFLSVECVKICFLSQGLNFGVSDYSWMADFYITCLSVSRIFCCSSVLISHSIYSQASLQQKKSRPTGCIREIISLNGVKYFATFVFSMSRKEGRKVRTSGFCFSVSLLLISTSASCLSSLYHTKYA